MADITTTPEEDLLIQQANKKALKKWLSDCALAELKAADTIATNGIRLLGTPARVELAQLCGFHGIPIDGTIGYARRRQEALTFMQLANQIHLRNTMRHLEIAHKVIKLTLNLMTNQDKAIWAIINDRAGIVSEGTTRANERMVVIQKWNEVKFMLYPKKEAA